MSMWLLAVIELFPTRAIGVLCVMLGVACVAIVVGCAFAGPMSRVLHETMANFLALSPFNKAVLVLALAVSIVYAQKGGMNEVERLGGGGQSNLLTCSAGRPNQESNLLCSPSTSDRGCSLRTVTPDDIARGWQAWETRTNETGFAMPANAVHNADWFRFGGHSMFDFVSFGEGWTFPYGTQELVRVTAMEDGGLRVKLPRSEDEIRAVPCPLAAFPRQSQFWRTTNGPDRVFAWRGFFAGGDTGAVVSASVELRANGDFVTRSNAVETLCRRIEPFDYDGDGIPNDRDERPSFYDGDHYGQSEAWVRTNFTNAEEILSVGYPQWVDEQVGIGLENGLYKLTATFPEAPRRTTLLTVGDLSVCVTNAGEYVFLLEKGVEYEFETVPYDDSVEYTMQDDVAHSAPVFTAWWWGGDVRGEWTVDGGWHWIDTPSVMGLGACLWMPKFHGAPDVLHLGVGDFPVTFEAVLSDFCSTNGVTYRWTTQTEGVHIVSPTSRTTVVTADSIPSWDQFSLTVEACLSGETLISTLETTYGTNSMPQVYPVLSTPRVVVLDGKRRKLQVAFSSDGDEENGILRLSCAKGCDRITLWSAQTGGTSVSPERSWPCSSFSGFECYIAGTNTSESVDDVEFTLTYLPESGDSKTLRGNVTVVDYVSEPISSIECPVLPDRPYMNPCAIQQGRPEAFWAILLPTNAPTSWLSWRAKEGQASFPNGNEGRMVHVDSSSSTLVLEALINGYDDEPDPIEFKVDVVHEEE